LCDARIKRRRDVIVSMSQKFQKPFSIKYIPRNEANIEKIKPY
jgi:hypothetical protein